MADLKKKKNNIIKIKVIVYKKTKKKQYDIKKNNFVAKG